MATKTPKTKKPELRSRVKASAVTQRPTYAELRQQLTDSLEREKTVRKDLQDRDQQLAESLRRENTTNKELQDAREQQTATSEILSVIASSSTDIQRVLKASPRMRRGSVRPTMLRSSKLRVIVCG